MDEEIQPEGKLPIQSRTVSTQTILLCVAIANLFSAKVALRLGCTREEVAEVISCAAPLLALLLRAVTSEPLRWKRK